MAAGDVFANLNQNIADGSPVTVQCASGVQACVTFLAGQNNNYLRFGGENSTGKSQSFSVGNGYDGNTNSMSKMVNTLNMKLFINNSQYMYLQCDDGTRSFSYSGIEI